MYRLSFNDSKLQMVSAVKASMEKIDWAQHSIISTKTVKEAMTLGERKPEVYP